MKWNRDELRGLTYLDTDASVALPDRESGGPPMRLWGNPERGTPASGGMRKWDEEGVEGHMDGQGVLYRGDQVPERARSGEGKGARARLKLGTAFFLLNFFFPLVQKRQRFTRGVGRGRGGGRRRRSVG